MFIAVHALVGAAIGSRVENDFLVAGMSLASHYLLDAIPHYDFSLDFDLNTPDFDGKNKEKAKIRNWTMQFKIMSILHLFLGFFLVRMIITDRLWRVFLGAFFAILPDIYEYVVLMFGKNRWLTGHPFHTRDVKSWYGVLTQVVIGLIAVLVLYNNT